MKYAIKMTGPVQQVLRAMLEDAAVPRYGLEISKQAGLETGTLYPVMARLGDASAGWKAGGSGSEHQRWPTAATLLPAD